VCVHTYIYTHTYIWHCRFHKVNFNFKVSHFEAQVMRKREKDGAGKQKCGARLVPLHVFASTDEVHTADVLILCVYAYVAIDVVYNNH
jgi:hypothetical protein